MDNETKKRVAKEMFDNMDLTKEQYMQVIQLVKDLELDVVEPEQSMEDMLNNL